MLWVVLLLCCFLLAWWSCRRHDTSLEPPSYPDKLPVIGHAHLFWNDLFNLLKNMTKYVIEQIRCEPFTMNLGPYKQYFISDPDDCWRISNACLKKHYIYNFGDRFVGKGLLTSNVETWKRDRKLLNPAFSFSVLNGFMPIFNDKAKQLVSDIASQVGKGPFKPDCFITEYVLKTTCYTNLHMDTDDIIGDKYKRSFDELLEIYMERIVKFWLHKESVYKCSQLYKKELALIQIINDITKDVILKRRSQLLVETQNIVNSKYEGANNLGKYNKPLIDLLLQLELEQGVFTEESLLHHLTTGIIATYDTTYKAIIYILLLIGSHKHVQERIHEELQQVFGDTERDVKNQDLSQLVYLEAVIKETLRLYPVTPYIARTSEADVHLKKYVIPAGSDIFILLYALNRGPIWGPDAEEFRPERWLEPGGVPDNPNAFSIFGIGKRSCIGRHYAMMMMKTTLAHFLSQYIVAGDVSKLEVELDIMLNPKSGHEISLELRK